MYAFHGSGIGEELLHLPGYEPIIPILRRFRGRYAELRGDVLLFGRLIRHCHHSAHLITFQNNISADVLALFGLVEYCQVPG